MYALSITICAIIHCIVDFHEQPCFLPSFNVAKYLYGTQVLPD